MVEAGLALGGFVLGLSVWFPFKHMLERLTKKKREATAMLRELAMSEQEHMQWTNPRTWASGTSSTTNQYTYTPYTDNATITPGQYGSAPVRTGTSSPTYVSTTTTTEPASWHTQGTPPVSGGQYPPPPRRGGTRRGTSS